MKVNYVSACLDASGYADAARNNIAALDHVGVKVDVTALTFEKFRSDLGTLGNKIKGMLVENSDADIQIVHTTPTVFNKVKRAKYNIGYTTWETTKLPPGWVDACNSMDEIWVPCTHNETVFQNSGVKVPIRRFPHTFNTALFDKEVVDINIQNKSDEFTFYSIFQWTERKNPLAILKAYLTEFKPHEKVCLILKTYLYDPTSELEKNKIKHFIAEVKDKLYLKNYPKILLIPSLLSKPQINGLHKKGDCYLSFHRDEGFGIPIVEAMMARKPVISTDYGGPRDFVTEEVGYPVDYHLTPCFGMPWETYSGDMLWADIDVMEARAAMREAFENQQQAKEKGEAARRSVEQLLSWDAVGTQMKQRLEWISR